MDVTEQEAIEALLALEDKIGEDAARQVRIIARVIGNDHPANAALVQLMGILAVQRETLVIVRETAGMGLKQPRF